MLYSGLARIPAASHNFTWYLYQSLVCPVLTSGFELFALDETDLRALQKQQNSIWRRLLHTGARAPSDLLYPICGKDDITTTLRVNRVSFLLRLLNSATFSWQHAALVVHRHINTTWFESSMADFMLVLPGARICVGEGPHG
eukprot:12408317-Karenia_brevis.AAC.1